jgi:hypothetical protein
MEIDGLMQSGAGTQVAELERLAAIPEEGAPGI